MATNPYLADQANAITNTATQNLQNNILPGINSGAVAAGGYGGSRQGIAQGLAIGQTNQGITNSLANLYGTNYQQDQNNDIARTGINNNFYTQQRGLDQSGLALGANLFSQGNLGFLGQGQGISNIGNTQQQAPWQAANNAGNVFSQFSGLGGSQVQQQQGSTLGGAIGGGLAGYQLGNLGFGGNVPQPAQPISNYSFTAPQNLPMPNYFGG